MSKEKSWFHWVRKAMGKGEIPPRPKRRLQGHTLPLPAPPLPAPPPPYLKDEKGDVILDYPAAARVIHMWLDEFADVGLRYPNMVAECARRASKELERVRRENESLKKEVERLKSKLDEEDILP
jgi:hypothetical protein